MRNDCVTGNDRGELNALIMGRSDNKLHIY